MFSRILVGLDGSEISKTAFTRALEFAKQYNGELHAVVAITPLHSRNHGNDALITKSESEASSLLEDLEHVAKENGVSYTSHLASGNPGELILETAEKICADLIVVGSLGKTHMERILLGSVSAYVTKYGKTNIIVIRN